VKVLSERSLLLLLAAVQFTHIVDFMILRSAGPFRPARLAGRGGGTGQCLAGQPGPGQRIRMANASTRRADCVSVRVNRTTPITKSILSELQTSNQKLNPLDPGAALFRQP
jgi:hypothetical protein